MCSLSISHIHMCMHTRTHTHACMHAHTHTHTHTHTHPHTHTYTHMLPLSFSLTSHQCTVSIWKQKHKQQQNHTPKFYLQHNLKSVAPQLLALSSHTLSVILSYIHKAAERQPLRARAKQHPHSDPLVHHQAIAGLICSCTISAGPSLSIVIQQSEKFCASNKEVTMKYCKTVNDQR